MTAAQGPPPEPMSRGTIVVSIAPAVRAVWGEDGWRAALERLPPETRAATTGANLLAVSWYPTRYLQDYERAIFDGPAARDEDSYRRYVDKRIDLGFGRFRRTLLRFASVERLAQRTSELWRHDQTHGTLRVDSLGEGTLRMSLRDHPYVDNALSRLGCSEIFRQILRIARFRDVRGTHALVDRALIMTFLWKDREGK